MEAIALQKYIHTSPRKLRLMADMVRKMAPARALDILNFTPKDAAKDLSLAIKTALANAKKLGIDQDKLIFKNLEVNESSKLRRFRASARGRTRPYKKRMAHIKIILTDDLVQSSKLKVQNEKQIKGKGGRQTEVVMDNSADSAK